MWCCTSELCTSLKVYFMSLIDFVFSVLMSYVIRLLMLSLMFLYTKPLIALCIVHRFVNLVAHLQVSAKHLHFLSATITYQLQRHGSVYILYVVQPTCF